MYGCLMGPRVRRRVNVESYTPNGSCEGHLQLLGARGVAEPSFSTQSETIGYTAGYKLYDPLQLSVELPSAGTGSCLAVA